jgi:hypothetical protein
LRTQRVILCGQSRELGSNLIEEGVHLVFVVTGVALLRRLEEDALNVLGSQRHLLSSGLGRAQH